jgi:hypothetical protein
MVHSLMNEKYDAFNRFDFTIEKFAALTVPEENPPQDPGTNVSHFPEPGTATLLLIALGGCQCMRGRRRNSKALGQTGFPPA